MTLNAHDPEIVTFLADSHEASLMAGDTRVLLDRAREGDEMARDHLMNGNAELAAILALRLRPNWMPEPDAIQEAIIVLKKLVDAGDAELFSKLGADIQEVLASLPRSNDKPPHA